MKDLHRSGAKDDSGKNRVGLMVEGFAAALLEVAEITTYGAQKYTDHGWRLVPDAKNRYSDALYRHLLEHARGKALDAESGRLHLAHAAWNLLALLQMELDAHQVPTSEPSSAEVLHSRIEACREALRGPVHVRSEN